MPNGNPVTSHPSSVNTSEPADVTPERRGRDGTRMQLVATEEGHGVHMATV